MFNKTDEDHRHQPQPLPWFFNHSFSGLGVETYPRTTGLHKEILEYEEP